MKNAGTTGKTTMVVSLQSIIVSVCLTIAAVSTSPANAQTRQQIDWCSGKDGATADQTIGGCTAVIKSGRFNNRQLAFAFVQRGFAWFEKKNYDRAIADYDGAIRSNPEYDLAYFRRALAWGRKDERDRQIADYSEVIRLNPTHVWAHNNRASSYRQKHDYDRALSDHDKAIELEQDALAYSNRASTYLDRNAAGDRERAISDLKEVLRLAPRYPQYHDLMDEAREQLRKLGAGP